MLNGSIAVALISLLTLPNRPAILGGGLDTSWAIATALALHRGLVFGREFIFSYGPFGFLATTGYVVPGMGVVSVWYRALLALALGWLVARALRRSFPLWLTAIVTALVVWTVGGAFAYGAEAVLVPLIVLMVGCVDALAIRTKQLPIVALAGMGVAVSICALTKYDTGLWMLSFSVAFVILESVVQGPKMSQTAARLGILGASVVVSLVVLWLILGQPISALGSFLRMSTEVFIGYDRAMVLDGARGWELTAGILAGALLVLPTMMLRIAPRRRIAITLFALSAVLLFIKQGFTRHDTGHAQRIFAVVLSIAVVCIPHLRPPVEPVLPGIERDRPANTAPRLLGALMMITAVFCGAMVHDLSLVGGTIQAPAPLDLARLLQRTVSSNNRDRIVAKQRIDVPPSLDIPASMFLKIGKNSVHIEPTETSIAWVFPKLNWHPLPVPQSYSAYTGLLDQQNANELLAKTGPTFVLYEAGSIDGRIPRFESAAANVALLCHYKIVQTSSRWQLFERTTNRCDGPTFDYNTEAPRLAERSDLGDFADDQLVVARMDGFAATGIDRFVELVSRPEQYWIRIGNNESDRLHRFVPGTAGQPHILSLPTCLRGQLGSYDTGTYSAITFFDRAQRRILNEALHASKGTKPATKSTSARRIRIRIEGLSYTCP